MTNLNVSDSGTCKFTKMICTKGLRKISHKLQNIQPSPFHPYVGYVEYSTIEGNELVRALLASGKPAMVAKFGTVELGCIENYLCTQKKHSMGEVFDYIQGRRKFLGWWDTLGSLRNQAGFFPSNAINASRFCELMLKDMELIDILGSYIREEELVASHLTEAKKIQLESYYAPFLFDNPWTEELEGKKVLVIHPFEDSIQQQYKKRRLLFSNPKVLPEFELLTLKAVQSIAGNSTGFPNWFDALDWMKTRVAHMDFDIALIGCGAYGLPLAAHIKRMGKQAVHLAGWTQILFGIYGERWLNDPITSKFINPLWVRPKQKEAPAGHKSVENGCYW
jgi:hypothetical protein